MKEKTSDVIISNLKAYNPAKVIDYSIVKIRIETKERNDVTIVSNTSQSDCTDDVTDKLTEEEGNANNKHHNFDNDAATSQQNLAEIKGKETNKSNSIRHGGDVTITSSTAKTLGPLKKRKYIYRDYEVSTGPLDLSKKVNNNNNNIKEEMTSQYQDTSGNNVTDLSLKNHKKKCNDEDKDELESSDITVDTESKCCDVTVSDESNTHDVIIVNETKPSNVTRGIGNNNLSDLPPIPKTKKIDQKIKKVRKFRSRGFLPYQTAGYLPHEYNNWRQHYPTTYPRYPTSTYTHPHDPLSVKEREIDSEIRKLQAMKREIGYYAMTSYRPSTYARYHDVTTAHTTHELVELKRMVEEQDTVQIRRHGTDRYRQTTMQDEKSCVRCRRQVASFLCSNCKAVWYCGRNCQVKTIIFRI